MKHWLRLRIPALAVFLALTVQTNQSHSCPFCQPGKTLSGAASDASMVFFGKLANANEKNNTTDIHVEVVLKDNSIRGNRKVLTLTPCQYLDKAGPNDRSLVFCKASKDGLRLSSSVPAMTGSKLPEYLRNAVQVKDKPLKQRLRFFFDFLENADPDIATDAYREFANADYTAEFRELLQDLPVERVIGWLKNPRTQPVRIGLYASMVGHSGHEKDAAVLRGILDDPERRSRDGVDGLLAAYTMVKSKEGWLYLVAALKDTRGSFEFRYAAFRAVRFLHDYRPDVVAKKELLDAACILLKQDDMPDIAIDHLRKWRAWDRAENVLAVARTDAGKQAIVKRAILRYCLCCEGSAKAKTYVQTCRHADAEVVKEIEDQLAKEKNSH
jgi:hypothetical protein